MSAASREEPPTSNWLKGCTSSLGVGAQGFAGRTTHKPFSGCGKPKLLTELDK